MAALGALLLAVAEFSTLYEVVAITAVVPGGTEKSGSNHFYMLLLLGVFGVLMAWGAVVGGSRPAAVAVTVAGAAALFVVLAIDLPVVTDEGLLAETYESAKASPQEGFWLEALGSVVLLGSGVAMLLLGTGRGEPAERGPRRPRRAAEASQPAPTGAADEAAPDAPPATEVPAER